MEMRVGNPNRLWDSCHVRDSSGKERVQYLFYHLPTCPSAWQRQCPGLRSSSDFYCAVLHSLFVLLELFCFVWIPLFVSREQS